MFHHDVASDLQLVHKRIKHSSGGAGGFDEKRNFLIRRKAVHMEKISL